jgi:hypothetical protein
MSEAISEIQKVWKTQEKQFSPLRYSNKRFLRDLNNFDFIPYTEFSLPFAFLQKSGLKNRKLAEKCEYWSLDTLRIEISNSKVQA